MSGRITSAIAAALAIAACAPVAAPQTDSAATAAARKAWSAACDDWDEWDKPGPPFRIHGNTWYVGTCGISAVLVTGKDGHVLIDSGTEKGAGVVAANVSALGFRVQDVKLLLHSHEHFDHVGGMAALQRLTGARLLASRDAAPVLASGRDSPGDPQAGMHAPFAAARVDGTIDPGKPVILGDVRLVAVATPGHTPGALTWQWQSCEGDDCRSIVYADSMTAISSDSYRFSDHPVYVAAFRAGIDRVFGLDCNILVTPHPSGSDMRARLAAGSLLGDGTACRTYAESARKRQEERLAKEAGN
jgi:metallo-beta-lactamase class B